MMELNLIPQAYRQQISRFQLLSLTKRIILLLMLYTICMAIGLLLVRFFMQTEFNRIVSETNLVTRENKGVENEVRAMNQEIEAAFQLQSKKIDWADFMIGLSRLTPDGITLSTAVFQNDGSSSIDGIAKTRDDLLLFKARLEDSPEIEKIDLPPSSLTSRENIPFSLKFTLRLKGSVK